VSHSGAGQAPDAEIRLGEPWLRWLYLLALGLVAAGIALALTARTADESYGTAVVTEPGGQFTALLPVAAVSGLAHARGLAVVLDGSRSQLAPPAQPSILLTGRLAPGAVTPPSGRTGRLVTSMALVLQSEPVGAIVVREFEVMLGTRQAGS